MSHNPGMEAFEYEPIDLEGPSFRLLLLHSGTAPDEIECTLLQAWFDGDSACPYDALSYTWGDTEKSDYIKIDGRRLDVTTNLYLALQDMRFPNTYRVLWVDAVCINQNNEAERGHQVQQMGCIYSRAEQVIIWLGQGRYETNAVMDSLKQLEEESREHPYKDWKLGDKHWIKLWSSVHGNLRSRYPGLERLQHEGINLLLDRPWFYRVWILQEVANARTAVVLSGNRSVSTRIFALAPFLIGVKPEPHCQAVLDIMPGASRNNSWWSQKRGLYTLLLKFRGSKATDPRDMIFALLGIALDVRDSNILRADYTKTVEEVIHDAASFLFGLSFPYRTMREFLSNLTSMNTTYLKRAAESYDANNIVRLLEERDEVQITEEFLEAVAENTSSGKDILALLLKQRKDKVKIIKKVLEAVAGNIASRKDILELLLKR
ncbi:hypothetical protein AFGD_008315 [Aspergillus flavus]|nr:hypothetical protein AFGD_008315 [Aspergillus flavus]